MHIHLLRVQICNVDVVVVVVVVIIVVVPVVVVAVEVIGHAHDGIYHGDHKPQKTNRGNLGEGGSGIQIELLHNKNFSVDIFGEFLFIV